MSDNPALTNQVDAVDMCSYAIDMWVKDPSILTDEAGLIALMHKAATAGDALVLGESAYRFPNGAVTAVLVLSQSHMSVHTWPEHSLANFDVLTCGRLNGERMIKYLEAGLETTRVNITRVIRDVFGPDEDAPTKVNPIA